jgi:hypothetical protein
MQIKDSAASQRQDLCRENRCGRVEAVGAMRAKIQGHGATSPDLREFAVICRACKRAKPVMRREAASFAAALQTTLVSLSPAEARML